MRIMFNPCSRRCESYGLIVNKEDMVIFQILSKGGFFMKKSITEETPPC